MSSVDDVGLRVTALDAQSELQEDALAQEYVQQHGRVSARNCWSFDHLLWPLLLFEAGLYVGLQGFQALFAALVLLVTGVLALTIAFRLTLVVLSLLHDPEVKVSSTELSQLSEQDLPTYTILVPLYKEANVAEGIVAALSRLDYPKHLLDIKLLLEADDEITVSAVRSLTFGEEFDTVLVPASLPRTKPKACNYGLKQARGEFTVIFDAEDRPDADQLKKVTWAFSQADASVACIQAKLNYYNPRVNFLTKSFALEYTAWFDLVLPAIQYLDGPIPLGGTSNHFRTKLLKELGGWDPYNVAEDCDLGVRISMLGHRTLLIDSTTWEEANSELHNWIRQRSRWVKGYMQTHLVHTKLAFNLVRTMGLRRAILFYLCVSSVPLQQLLNLVCLPVLGAYAMLLTYDLLQGRDLWVVIAGSREEYRTAWKMLFLEAGEDPVWSRFAVFGFVASICMLLTNLMFILVNLLAARRRGYSDLWLTAILSPVYWVLGAVAAWKGAIQLVVRPHYWEKTIHGLASAVSDAKEGGTS